MKLSMIPKCTKFLGTGVLTAALLTAGAVRAAEPSPETPASNPTTKGSGAARLSGNSETQPPGSKGYESSSSDMDSHSLTAKSFLKEAVEGNLAEVALAEVAARKAQNPQVKQLAQMLQQDHRKANQQLEPIAQAHGISMNQSLEAKHQKKLDRFQQLSGSEFDKEYTKDMLKDHQKDIAKYERAAQQIQESDVQQYAQTTLPKLRQHLQHAQQAALAAGIDQSTITSILNKSPESVGGTSEQQEKETGSSSSQEQPQPQVPQSQAPTPTP